MSASLSAEQMRSAIPKLNRRIKELEEFNPDSLTQRGDPHVTAIETKLEDTIAEIFGHGTVEHGRFRPGSLDSAGYNMMYETPLGAVIQSIHEGKQREIVNLRTIIELFTEKLEDSGETPASRARRAFGDLELIRK